MDYNLENQGLTFQVVFARLQKIDTFSRGLIYIRKGHLPPRKTLFWEKLANAFLIMRKSKKLEAFLPVSFNAKLRILPLL